MSFRAKGFNPRITYCTEFLCLLQSGIFPKSLLDFRDIDLTIWKLTNESYFKKCLSSLVYQIVPYNLLLCIVGLPWFGGSGGKESACNADVS